MPARQRVHTKARLRSALNRKDSPAPLSQSLVSKPNAKAALPNESLAAGNDRLQQQVQVLKEAFKHAESKKKSAAHRKFKASNRLISQTDNSRRQTAEVIQRVREIKTRILKGSQGELQGKGLDKELLNLQNWAAKNQNTYGQVARDLDRDLDGLLGEIKDAQKALEGQRGKLKGAKEVRFDIADFVQEKGENAQLQLEAFLGANLRFNDAGENVAFSIQDGQVIVANADDNADIIFDGLSNFRENAGSVVQVSGQEIANPSVESNPALAGLFTSTLADGRSYAVLDQAQYQTIIEAARNLGGPAVLGSNPSRRDVIVGSRNKLANETVVISESGADFNGLTVSGTELNLDG